MPDHARLVHCASLVEGGLPFLAVKCDVDMSRVVPLHRSHGSDDDLPDASVPFVRRDDQAMRGAERADKGSSYRWMSATVAIPACFDDSPSCRAIGR